MVGIARAQQLAALATNGLRRQAAAGETLAASLTDTQLARITEPGLCHGIAGPIGPPAALPATPEAGMIRTIDVLRRCTFTVEGHDRPAMVADRWGFVLPNGTVEKGRRDA
jgi:hypothetical protein